MRPIQLVNLVLLLVTGQLEMKKLYASIQSSFKLFYSLHILQARWLFLSKTCEQIRNLQLSIRLKLPLLRALSLVVVLMRTFVVFLLTTKPKILSKSLKKLTLAITFSRTLLIYVGIPILSIVIISFHNSIQFYLKS